MVRYNRYYQYASDLCVRLPAWTLFLCFRPHLLVHNDTAPIPQQALEGVSCRMEMLYSDSMDARVMADGMVSQMRDMSTEDLLRTVAVAAALDGPG